LVNLLPKSYQVRGASTRSGHATTTRIDDPGCRVTYDIEFKNTVTSADGGA
jgi:hypothetical protein